VKQRNPIAVALLPFITFGIYGIYWQVATKEELNQKGANIPTAWLIIVPLVNIWWLWKYSEGVEHVTNGKMSAVIAFILLFLLSSIGAAVIQDTYNKLSPSDQPVTPTPVAPTPPEVAAPPTNPVS
jgi:EamA domain-containing membrane protein RarD